MKTDASVKFIVTLFGTLIVALPVTRSMAAPPNDAGRSGDEITSLSLREAYALGDNAARSSVYKLTGNAQYQESTTVTTQEETESWDLVGPYFLRSADPEPPGELELKFIYGYETSADESEHEFEFVLEWGMAENHEFILEVPVTIGDGRIEGNGDITEFGFHTRFWEESDWLPAFAMRNLIRIPSGYHSDGVDYLGRGLFTKTFIPDTLRAHFNPFLKSVNGNLEEGERHFQWGAAVGVDYRVNDDLVLIADYQNRSSELVGNRNDHILELGGDWEFAEDQTLGFSTTFGLDGDESGADWSFRISYIIELDAPRLDGR